MASSYWHKNTDNIIEEKVKCIVPDNYDEFRKLKIDFIKIDVEGAEGDVIQGIKSLIKSNMPIIFIECSEIGRHKVWEILNNLQYQCFLAKNTDVAIKKFDEYYHNDFLWLPPL